LTISCCCAFSLEMISCLRFLVSVSNPPPLFIHLFCYFSFRAFIHYFYLFIYLFNLFVCLFVCEFHFH
jgi:hypothetical protein